MDSAVVKSPKASLSWTGRVLICFHFSKPRKKDKSLYVFLKNYEDDYDQGPRDGYTYEDGALQINGHQRIPQSHTWSQQSEDHQFTQGDPYTSVGTEKSTETTDFSTEEYEPKPYPQGANNHVEYNGDGGYGDNQSRNRNHYQVSSPFK